jgi:hypothetical protein
MKKKSSFGSFKCLENSYSKFYNVMEMKFKLENKVLM